MAKVEDKVAKRYARAFFDALEPSVLEAACESLKSFAQTWEESSELRETLKNPGLPLARREDSLREIAQRIAIQPLRQELLASFFVLLLQAGRIDAASRVAMIFSQMVDQLKKVLALEITSAFPISDGEKGEIQERMQRDFGSLASVVWNVQPSILGGLIIKAGDRQLDGSVEGSLQRLRAELAQ